MITDVRRALRSLLKSPGFTIPAVLCLALAIGANTAIFTVVNAVLLRPLPYADPSALVMVWERSSRKPTGHNVVSPADYVDWTSRNKVFAATAAVVDWRASVTGIGEPIQVPIEYATATTFNVLGVRPQLGRSFSAAEDGPGGDPVVLVSHEFWQTHFNADPHVIGRALNVGGQPQTIIGVMPAGFQFPGSDVDLWLPLAIDPVKDYRKAAGRYLRTVARLRPGVTADQADREMRGIAGQLETEHPDFNGGWSAVVVPLGEQITGSARAPLLVLLGVVGFVLLIACANVANLQLARGARRRQELAVRAALGASRWRVVRELLTESLVLSGIGGVLGLGLAVWGTAALVAAAPHSLPRAAEIRIDGLTLAFTAALALLTGVVFGAVPALHASRSDLNDVMKEGGRGSAGGRLRGGLVTAQLALSLVLLVGAGLLIRSFVRLSAESPGFNPDGVLTAKVDLPSSRYAEGVPQVRFFSELLERVRAIPGVTAASAITWLPFSGPGAATSYTVQGHPPLRSDEEPVADILAVDPGYFHTMQIPLVSGTSFSSREDLSSRKAVVIDEALVRSVFAGENPIGQHILMPWGDTLVGEIVGVAADTRSAGLDSLPRPTIYWAMAQFPSSFMTLLVRGGAASSLPVAMGRELHALDPELPLADVRMLESYLGQSVASRRFVMLLLGAFAAVALLLAAVGISGVLANMVAQRTREIGVRMALGAEPGAVVSMVLRQGMRLAVTGVAIGVLASLALTRVLRSLLYGVSTADLPTYAAVAVVLGGATLIAAYLPARRASRVDPVVALRSE